MKLPAPPACILFLKAFLVRPSKLVSVDHEMIAAIKNNTIFHRNISMLKKMTSVTQIRLGQKDFLKLKTWIGAMSPQTEEEPHASDK